MSINIQLQDQVLSFAQFNEYGMDAADCGYINGTEIEDGGYSDYGF